MADFNDKNLLTADLALTNFGTGKWASNLTESNSIPKKVMAVEGPRVFSLVLGQKPPRQKPPRHKPPDKNPLDKNPLAKNPLDKNPPDKNPPDKTFFSEIL